MLTSLTSKLNTKMPSISSLKSFPNYKMPLATTTTLDLINTLWSKWATSLFLSPKRSPLLPPSFPRDTNYSLSLPLLSYPNSDKADLLLIKPLLYSKNSLNGYKTISKTSSTNTPSYLTTSTPLLPTKLKFLTNSLTLISPPPWPLSMLLSKTFLTPMMPLLLSLMP